MISLSQHVWRATGAPPLPGQRDAAPCCVCGGDGAPVVDADGQLSDSFSAHRDMASISSRGLCVACAHAMAGKPPATWRLWSVLWREDGVSESRAGAPWSGLGLTLTNRAQTRMLLTTLLHPPACAWGMALADSGQIHVMPLAPLNLAGVRAWHVRLERNNVRCAPDGFRMLVHACASLVAAGFTRTEVEALEPHSSSLVKYGAHVWRQHAAVLRSVVRSPLMDLALFMVRKEEAADVANLTAKPVC